MKPVFDHEKLNVYQDSLAFIAKLDEVLNNIPKSLSVTNQLDRACTSIPLNIAEGNGKYTPKDRCRFFDIARGSALECAACLDVLRIKKQLEEEQVAELKEILRGIVAMLVGLIRNNSSDRVHEGKAEYRTNAD